MNQPELVDNLSEETRHERALAYLVAEYDGHPLSVATGYVNLGGLAALAGIADGRPARIMIGAEPERGLGTSPPVSETFNHQLLVLRGERDLSRFPPSRNSKQLAKVAEWLDRDEVEVRRFTERFLHGKAYLLGQPGQGKAALVTSANLTSAGLSRNLELGMVNYQPGQSNAALNWFESLWSDASEFKEQLRDLLFPGVEFADPFDVYLRALLELHDPLETDRDRASRPSIELANFQRDGYERARDIMERHGGVIYADGVGTGKTEIGLAFVEETTKESGQHALIVTPAQLKKRWEDRINQARLAAQVISFHDLASDEQLVTGPGTTRRLSMRKDAYRLVVVDEAHALRNDDTTWHQAMERLLGGTEKRVLLLTATPINNTLWDLFNLVMLFARHDLGLATAGIDSIRELFVRAGANSRDPEDLNPEILYPLAEAVAVRRDRVFIEQAYRNAHFPDGTPVRFPSPKLDTRRYDLDEALPGLFDEITRRIGMLSMARYTPGRFLLEGDRYESRDAQVAGLILSGVLKRFESCWHACLATVNRMVEAHEAFLEAWDQGTALTGKALLEAVKQEYGGSDLADWIASQDDSIETTPRTDYDPAFAEQVTADKATLKEIAGLLSEITPETDPKLALLLDAIERSPAEKLAVFATFADTVRYLDENLPGPIGGRERVTVIGSVTSPDERSAAMARFSPKTIVDAQYEPPDEVDLLLATDVLSEGQNMQQAQAVISYDMPWNPQRVVQRNGRVIRLMSPHREVFLTTMLPEPGELDALLGLEATIQGKIKAAGVFGMESGVIEAATIDEELRQGRSFTERLESNDEALLTEQENESGAFIGEELRRIVDRAAREGLAQRVQEMPWGVGACFRRTATSSSTGPTGIFFATRTPPMPGAEMGGFRYWRYVDLETEETTDIELEILRAIDPAGSNGCEIPEDLDIEAAWEKAAAEIVTEHNSRLDLRAADSERIGPRQRWALDLIRDPSVNYSSEGRAEQAVAALSVARSTSFRRGVTELEARTDAGEMTRDEAAEAIIELVEEFGYRPVSALARPEPISQDDLGVVCWMAVLPPASS